ncbi:MAG: BMP family ABC transporter substrate-binding protein [Pelolinea sp.]|nr:BMP family ABC transporter substrate-binding protein [Pelolinea sp.]
MLKRKVMLISVLLIFAVVLSACGSPAATVSEKTKVAFIYIGQPGDLGWTFEHDRGRLMLEAELGDLVETITVPDVSEGPDAEKAIRDVVEAGAKIVFTTSFGYMDPTLAVAEQYPDVIFEHCSGYKTADNMSTYFGRIYQPRYLSGLVAGSMTEANFIGYVAAFPIPEVVRGINAFTLGVKEVNPDAKVHVVWSNTWYDPVKEREAAIALLDEGADIITQHQDTTEPQKAAMEYEKLSVGYDSDMAQFVGDTVLTSPVWNWGKYYVATVQSVLDGTWEPHQYWGGLADEVVKLADFSPLVPEDIKLMVEAKKAELVSGDWDVFCGPIADQDGTVVVADGECMEDGDMLGMAWFVDGVVGTIPAE